MRLAKCSRGSDHSEKIEQRGNWRRVDFLHGVDQLIAKTRVRKLFAQPMELLHDAIPRHGIVDAALIANMLLHQNPLVLGVDGDAGAESL